MSEEAKGDAHTQLNSMDGRPSIPNKAGVTKDKNLGNVGGVLKALIPYMVIISLEHTKVSRSRRRRRENLDNT